MYLATCIYHNDGKEIYWLVDFEKSLYALVLHPCYLKKKSRALCKLHLIFGFIGESNSFPLSSEPKPMFSREPNVHDILIRTSLLQQSVPLFFILSTCVKCILWWAIKSTLILFSIHFNSGILHRKKDSNSKKYWNSKWRIQDFPEEGAPTPWGRQHTILPNFPKNCMKLKEFGSGGGVPRAPPLDPPLNSHRLLVGNSCYFTRKFRFDKISTQLLENISQQSQVRRDWLKLW